VAIRIKAVNNRAMRIVFLASGEFAQPTLRWLAQSGHDVPLVITQPARASGRGRRVTRTPAQALADELGIPVLAVEDVNAADVEARIQALDARLGLVVAFGQKIGPALLGSLPGGCVNLHASLLPKYRGAAPIHWAIVGGETKTGCTVFRIVERMDAGPILAQDETPIGEMETAGELHDRLAELGVQTAQKALDQFEGGRIPAGTPQDHARRTLAPKLKKADGLIRFDCPAAKVVRHIHGMTPWPGAVARFEAQDGRWEDVAITRTRVIADGGPGAGALDPGTIGEHRYVAAADGWIEVLEVKPSFGRTMTWGDYVNGRHVAAGDRMVTIAPPV
jgi:methionyl-tRNA formyltransferase